MKDRKEVLASLKEELDLVKPNPWEDDYDDPYGLENAELIEAFEEVIAYYKFIIEEYE